MDKTWKDRMENEDKILINKNETLHAIVDRLEQEVTILKTKHNISAVSTVAVRGVEAVILVHVLLAFRVNGCLRV